METENSNNESVTVRPDRMWKLNQRSLPTGRYTLIMGVINLTADSFSDGGRYLDPADAVAQGLYLLDEGADILDLGAESTRPGSQAGDPATAAVSAQQEQDQLLPVIEGIFRERPEAILSIDTYKAATARAALAAGAAIINDVSGFTWDNEMAAACAEAQCGVVLMHTRGTPQEWKSQARQSGSELLAMVSTGLAESLRIAEAAGIAAERIVLDPGYGFGKKFEENYALLARQAELLSFGRPLLAGLSRKSFLQRTLAKAADSELEKVSEESREAASIAALTTAILHGASIVRVHRVRQAVEAAAIADAVLAAGR